MDVKDEQIIGILKDIAGSLHQIALTQRLIRDKIEESNKGEKAQREFTSTLMDVLLKSTCTEKDEERK